MQTPIKSTAFIRTTTLLRAMAIAFLLPVLVFCIFYLTHSHPYLAAWFRNLHPCFYRSAFWEKDFFTDATKQKGNLLCWLGIIIIGLLVFIVLLRKGAHVKRQIKPLAVIKPADYLLSGSLVVIGIIMWKFAKWHILPYNDEVFSAVHCADIHPFQTLAYYMLPNNHILFNLLNNVLFPFAKDHWATGRIVSGASFILLLVLLYFWCRQLFGHRLLAFMATLCISVHFQTWGFGAMNRGYELYLLCEWAAFVFLWQYLRRGNTVWLQLFAVCVVAGFFTLPTFLFFYVSLVVAALIVQCYRCSFDMAFFRYNVIAICATFLCYLPALSFSGIGAFTDNEYVKGADLSHSAYMDVLIVKFHEALEYCFTGYTTVHEDVYLLLAAVPVLSLLWLRKRSRVFFGGFFLIMWVTLFLMSWQMKQFPYLRNQIGHMSITYAFIIITICWALQELFRALRMKRMIFVVFPLFLGLFIYHYIKLTKAKLAEALYHFDINTYAELLILDLRDLPPHATVGCSDESFYLKYIGGKRGFQTNFCSAGNEAYYITTDGETIPIPITGHYEFRWPRGDFRIYQLILNNASADSLQSPNTPAVR